MDRETGAGQADAPEPSRTGRGGLALKLAVVAVCVVAGAATSLVIVAGGPQRLVEAVAEIPARAAGQVHGLWDSRRLDLELADLQTQVGPRDVESLVLFERSMSLWAFSETDPKGADVYWFRDGRLEESSTSTAVSFASPFRLADLDAEVVNEVTRRIYADTPGAEIENLVIRNPQGKRLRIDVSIAGEYDDASRIFDARTGEEVGPR